MYKKRALACDHCRRSKRKCDGNEPCSLCYKYNRACSYSHDNRVRRMSIGEDLKRPQRTAIMKTKPPTPDGSEKIYTFFVEPTLNQDSQISDREAATILGKLYGSISTGSSPGKLGNVLPGDKKDTIHHDHEQHGPPTATFRHTPTEALKVRGYGQTVALQLGHATCEKLIQNVIDKHAVVNQWFSGGRTAYEELYNKSFQTTVEESPSVFLCLYSIFCLGSIKRPLMSLEDATELTRELFTAASSLVGPTLIECSTASAQALEVFGHLCFQVGIMLAQSKFGRMALDVLINLGYHHSVPNDDENLVRQFWSTYSMAYLNSAIIFYNGEVLDFKKTLVRRPKLRDEHDTQCKYLNLKIELIRAYSNYKHNSVKDGEMFRELYNELKAIKTVAMNELGNSVQNAATQSLYITCLSINVHLCALGYKDLSDRTAAEMVMFRNEADFYTSIVCDSAILNTESMFDTLHLVSHLLFVISMILIYSRRQHPGDPTFDFDRSFDLTINTLNRCKENVKNAPKWIEILKFLKQSEHAPGLSPSSSVASPYSADDALVDLHEFFQMDDFLLRDTTSVEWLISDLIS